MNLLYGTGRHIDLIGDYPIQTTALFPHQAQIPTALVFDFDNLDCPH